MHPPHLEKNTSGCSGIHAAVWMLTNFEILFLKLNGKENDNSLIFVTELLATFQNLENESIDDNPRWASKFD